MLQLSGLSCSYKNGALLAKFLPGVLNPFVLICGCLLYCTCDGCCPPEGVDPLTGRVPVTNVQKTNKQQQRSPARVQAHTQWNIR